MASGYNILTLVIVVLPYVSPYDKGTMNADSKKGLKA